MPPYHGKGGVVYMSTTGSGNATNVVQLTEWTLNRTTDKVETTAFGDANKTYVQGLPDVQGEISGFWDSATDQLFDAAESADGVKVYLYPSRDAATVYFYGPAWVDASLSVAVNGAIAISASFSANGSWGRKP
jgi:hypothetical protein